MLPDKPPLEHSSLHLSSAARHVVISVFSFILTVLLQCSLCPVPSYKPITNINIATCNVFRPPALHWHHLHNVVNAICFNLLIWHVLTARAIDTLSHNFRHSASRRHHMCESVVGRSSTCTICQYPLVVFDCWVCSASAQACCVLVA